MPSRSVVQSLHLLKPLRSPARWYHDHMLPLTMPLAFADACSALLVDKAQGTKPTAQAASSLCHPFGTSRPDKRVGRALDRTWFRSRAPNCHHSLLPPCAYSTSVMPNHSRLNGSPRPAVGTVPPGISSSIGCARDYLGRPTSFFRQILSLLRLTTSLHLPPCLMSTPAIGHRDFHWYSASQPSPASWFSGARRRPSSVCALPLEQVPQHLLGAVELMSPSSGHLAHRSSLAPSSFCCQTVPPGELTHRVPPVSFSSWKHLSHLRICVQGRLADHYIDPLYLETAIHR
jgi:hypothetical protein